jgi:hypothetical protein
LLDDARERAFVQIEAAAQVLAHVDKGADEALGYLAHARQQPLGLSAWINALRLLALQQSGRNEARALLAAPPKLAALGTPPASSFSAEFPLLPPGLFASLAALLGERAGAASPSRSPARGSGNQGRAR